MQIHRNLIAALLVLDTTLSGAVADVDISVDADISIGQKHAPIPRMVFAHFMYDDDMKRAKSYGIDAFALNIGETSSVCRQPAEEFILIFEYPVGYAYESAEKNGMKATTSTIGWSPSNGTGIGNHLAQYTSRPAQLQINGAAFVSSFAGDALNVTALRTAAGTQLIPPRPPPLTSSTNWMAWPNNGTNKAPTAAVNLTVADGDRAYEAVLDGKPYMAPASPWFSTHYGPEVSYSKNWVFPGDLLWTMVHQNGSMTRPRRNFPAADIKWADRLSTLQAWLDMAKRFIAAYKAGASSPDRFITQDQIIYWYRPTLSTLDCDATDTTAGRAANNDSGNYFEGMRYFPLLRSPVYLPHPAAPEWLHLDARRHLRRHASHQSRKTHCLVWTGRAGPKSPGLGWALAGLGLTFPEPEP
ncbi:glycosyl hydrolase family 71-domain-containing protein [Roridomyces roridus]|uniref:Glycosyl hydrolase family 71-domain-containing protein n=1 Tax=Roridomyces roridus TaxID=1738132 RepID=A0AAD7C935_9AGAR|nr:glycosyl hydrolase family 71-domain-containing protein [Roridomyces roridus]